MNAGQITRVLTYALPLASSAIALCSAVRPLAPRALGASAHRRPTWTPASVDAEPVSPSVRAFERYRLSQRDSIVRIALTQVGRPYRLGGSTPDIGFDCSGLVSYVASRLALRPLPPRTAAKQSRTGTAIRQDRLQPGDILTFGNGDSVTHVGIYVGDRRFVHASSVAGRVVLSRIDRPPSELIRPLKGARRILAVRESALGHLEPKFSRGTRRSR